MNQPNTFIKPSQIHGIGLFASRDISEGEEIIPADKIDYTANAREWIAYQKRTKQTSMALVLGTCPVNHSDVPNMRRGEAEDLPMYASRDILQGEEITENYHALPDSQNPFKPHLDEFIFRAMESAKGR
jgi:SET domain-containing protein